MAKQRSWLESISAWEQVSGKPYGQRSVNVKYCHLPLNLLSPEQPHTPRPGTPTEKDKKIDIALHIIHFIQKSIHLRIIYLLLKHFLNNFKESVVNNLNKRKIHFCSVSLSLRHILSTSLVSQ